jgi:Loader and inhibitor of phage G40P
MNKNEVIDVLEHLSCIFIGRFDADNKTVEAWYFHLKDQNKEEVMEKVKKYVRNNKFPPTVSDLVSSKHYFKS